MGGQVPLLFLTVLAAALLWWQVDLAPLRYDDVDVLSRARDVLTNGLIATGPLTSWGIPDPPGSVYVMLPAALAPTPAAAAVFWVGLLNVLAVALTYVMTRRAFGPAVAFAAGLLFAVNPWAVYFSRRSWAEIMPLFTVFALWAAYDVVVWRQAPWGAPFFVALAVQVQVRILAFIYGPAALLSLLLWPRRWGIRWPALGIVLGALLTVPYLGWIALHWSQVTAMLAEGNRGLAEAPRGAEAGLVLWTAAGYGLLPASSTVAPWLDPLGRAGTVALALVGVLLAAGIAMAGVAAVRRHTCWEPLALAVIWSILPVAALIVQSSSVYLHYLVALFPALFIVLAVPIGWLLAHRRRAVAALGVAVLGYLVAYQLTTTAVLHRVMTAYDVDDPPSAALALRQAAAGIPREASELLGTGERYGVELPIRFWQALADAAVDESRRSDAPEVFVLAGDVNPLTAERPAVLDYLLRPRVEPRFLAGDTLVFPMLRPVVYVELPEIDPIESLERFGERRGRVPTPSVNREGRSYARVTLVPGRGPQGWESLAPTRLTARFEDDVRFMGYRADQRTARIGDELTVNTMWWVSSRSPSGLVVSPRLVDGSGQVFRTEATEWALLTVPPGDWVLVRRDVLTLDGPLAAGQYGLEVAILDPAGRPLQRVDQPGESVPLTTVRVTGR